jgi:hypothetical protein
MAIAVREKVKEIQQKDCSGKAFALGFLDVHDRPWIVEIRQEETEVKP